MPPRRLPSALPTTHLTVPHPAAARTPDIPSGLPFNRHPGSLPTVIPAKAGIYACRLHYQLPQPSHRLPQPSFRRKPESTPAASITASPNRHPGSLPTVIPAKAGIYACRLHYQLPQPSSRLPPTVIPTQAGIYACRLHHHSRGCTAPDSGASRNNGCRGAENGENRRPTAVNRNITTRPRRPNHPPRRRPNPPGIPSGLPLAPQLRPAIPTTRNRSCPARRPRLQPGRVVISTVIPSPPNRHSGASRNLRLPAPLPSPPTVTPPPPTVIPACAGIYACRLHYQLPQPSSRLPPNRHSDESRNLRPPAPSP